MKLLIVSDSHGDGDILQELKARHSQNVDYMIHCGDSELSSDQAEMAGYVAVRGNCDTDARYKNEELIDTDNGNVWITHGHLYGVKSSLLGLSLRAKEVAARIVCFGHSHQLGAEMVDQILYLNPNSISLPRQPKEKTYMLVDWTAQKVVVSIWTRDGIELQEWQQSFSFA
ncbi:metallophosphoesterase [Cytobacillus sp. FSL K6-0265]|uniref:metallophosphoesterase n=1 Tax=Cytobacillus sp. FSL K6-0265 TaxID=2921448 RepID=UPI0030FA4AC7